MVRILNIACMVLIGLTILCLYQLSEKTRVTQMDLSRTQHQIAEQRRALSVLETEWQHVASPAQIQKLAVSRLGMGDSASVQLSSFDLLPRRGAAPLNDTPLRNASVQIPAASLPPAPVPTSHSGM